MHEYTFTLILAAEPSEEQIGVLYGYFGANGEAPGSVQDVLIGTAAGGPYAVCTAQGDSFDQALRDVLGGFHREGIQVERIELDQEAVQILTAA